MTNLIRVQLPAVRRFRAKEPDKLFGNGGSQMFGKKPTPAITDADRALLQAFGPGVSTSFDDLHDGAVRILPWRVEKACHANLVSYFEPFHGRNPRVHLITDAKPKWYRFTHFLCVAFRLIGFLYPRRPRFSGNQSAYSQMGSNLCPTSL